MLDKIKNNCYNHHSEIHKGTNSNIPYTFGMSRQRVCGPALIPWTVPCGMSLYVKALTAIIAYIWPCFQRNRFGVLRSACKYAPCKKCGRVSSRTFVSPEPLMKRISSVFS